jgi:hypothetical protein
MGAERCRVVFARPDDVGYRAFRRAVSFDKLPAITPLSVLLSPPPMKYIRPEEKHGTWYIGCMRIRVCVIGAPVASRNGGPNLQQRRPGR